MINKKGLVVKFILYLLLAVIMIVVVVPRTCDILQPTLKQGKASFNTFVTELNELNKEGIIDQKENYVLALDKDSAIVFFDPGYTVVEIVTSGDKYFFNRPNDCENDKNCFCLFRTIEDEGEQFNYEKRLCYELDYKLTMSDCTPPGHYVQDEDNTLVVCSNGFFIPRGIEDFEGQKNANYELTKINGGIILVKK